MSEMVEKIAMAIRDNIQASLPDGVSVDYQYAARAAIEAMREPTRDVLSAFVDADTSFDDAKTRWECAIDAALSEVEG